MSTQATPRRAEGVGTASSGTASSAALFPAVLMVLASVCSILTGIAAMSHDAVLAGAPQYTYALDLAAWGWMHIVLAVLLGGAGVAVLRGTTWARALGFTAAALGLVANFAFLPYSPIWGLTLVALNVIVIWELAAYRTTTA